MCCGFLGCQHVNQLMNNQAPDAKITAGLGLTGLSVYLGCEQK